VTAEFHPVKYLAPGWFASVMGTGGLANILYIWGAVFTPGCTLGIGLAALAAVAYFIILIPWIVRWIAYYPYVQRDLHHPVTSNFFVTMPVATVIIGTNINIIWSRFLGETVAYFLMVASWMIAIIGVSCFTFYTTFRIMRVDIAPPPEATNFSWIMAPIANMAVLLIGNPVLGMTIARYPEWAMSVLMINAMLLGIGFFLFIFISAIIFVRLAQHPLPPAETTPTFGIFLSAVGLAVSAIIEGAKHAQAMGLLHSPDLANLGAAVIWGFGFWIVGIIVIICIYHLRRGGIPFTLGWWAFIFPLAAYTLASQKIAAIYPAPVTYGYALGLTLLLIALWLYTFTNTLRGVASGRLFMGTPIPGNPTANS